MSNPRLDRKSSPTHGPLIRKKITAQTQRKKGGWVRHDLGKTTSFPVGSGKANNGQKTMAEQQSNDVFMQVTVSWSGTCILAYNLLFVVSPCCFHSHNNRSTCPLFTLHGITNQFLKHRLILQRLVTSHELRVLSQFARSSEWSRAILNP